MRSAPPRAGRWGRVARVAGFDPHVVATLLFRSWSVIAGAVTVAVMPLWLGQVEQGYYYTFASLLALQIFFELGMNQVILQLVAHDYAHLSVDPAGTLTGDARRMGRLASLVRLLRRWYLCAAAGFGLIVGTSGIVFFLTKGTLPAGAWLGAWLSVCLGSALNLYFSVSLTVLEGCGEIAKVARLRLLQSLTGYMLMWLALSLGAGLWAVPLIPLAGACCTGLWLRHEGRLLDLLHRQLEGAPQDRIRWRTDIFPLQWRIALSWISGYFIFNLFAPLTFARLGAIEAGRVGIALAIFNALMTVGMSWVNASVPTMAGHISRHERAELNRVFVAVTQRSIGFTVFAVAVTLIAIQLLSMAGAPLAARIAGMPVLVCLGVVTVVNGLVYAAASYMRAHKEEPMLWVSVVSGILTLVAAFAAVGSGVLTMMLWYAAVAALVALPWTAWLFRGYYRRTV